MLFTYEILQAQAEFKRMLSVQARHPHQADEKASRHCRELERDHHTKPGSFRFTLVKRHN